jgi:hypothetical protein
MEDILELAREHCNNLQPWGFFFSILGFELRALGLLGKALCT